MTRETIQTAIETFGIGLGLWLITATILWSI